MLGKRKPQSDLFDVGNVFPLVLDCSSFHSQLASLGSGLLCDEEFCALYSDSLGRPSVSPSQLALLLILQTYHGVSDHEAIERSAYDLRWCAVLRRPAGTPLCAKSTLQLFRAHLILHEGHRSLLRSSLAAARKSGLLTNNSVKAALDTKPILGRGAVEDTYNLLASAMRQLAREVARCEQMTLSAFLAKHGFERLGATSIKGSADIDWSDESACAGLLFDLSQAARRLIALADGSDAKVKASAQLLEQIMLQDVEEHPASPTGEPGRATLRKGTAHGRIPSVTDSEQRHGRKSASKRFTGHKASIAADVDTGLILAVDVIAGDAGDATGALNLVRDASDNAAVQVAEVLADCAYGSGETRAQFAASKVELVAKVPSGPAGGQFFPKSKFRIELPVETLSLEHATVTCPGGWVSDRVQSDSHGGAVFYFDEHCAGCALRSRCTSSQYGRSVSLHPQERLIQAARQQQGTPDGRAKLRKRLVVENALARLAGLGIGQARYTGHVKTQFQLTLAATVANLRRTWNLNQAHGSKSQAAAA
jgi:hypothetical protein